VKSFGIAASGVSPAPAYITRTRAMTLAISHMRTAGGQKSHEKAEYYDKRRKIIKRHALKEKIDPARLEGFTELQRKSLERDSKLTSFQAIFKRLSFKESIDVFNIGSRKERKDAWNILLEKRVRQEKLEPEVEQMFYNLKLNQAQIDDRVKADIKVIRNAAWGIARSDISDRRRDEYMETLKSNPQYEEGVKFAVTALRHRYLFKLDGTRSGRKLTSPSYRKKVHQLLEALKSSK